MLLAMAIFATIIMTALLLENDDLIGLGLRDNFCRDRQAVGGFHLSGIASKQNVSQRNGITSNACQLFNNDLVSGSNAILLATRAHDCEHGSLLFHKSLPAQKGSQGTPARKVGSLMELGESVNLSGSHSMGEIMVVNIFPPIMERLVIREPDEGKCGAYQPHNPGGQANVQRLDAILRFLLAVVLVFGPIMNPARADLRTTPGWYDQNAVTTTPDWHYRVPINIPAGTSINSTIKLDVDFNALLATMGVSGTFDVNSPRVVRTGGALSTIQEFTDSVYTGVTDTAGNGRGEVRFIVEDTGFAVPYYLYFDVTQNGAKPVNPQGPINGNFERGATGTAQPTAWNAPTGLASLDAQVRPNETVSVTSNGTGANPNPVNTDGSPNSGDFSYLIGARSADEASNNTRVITRTFTVPTTNSGNFTIRWKPEGWDSSNFDTLTVNLTAGATTVNVVGPSVAYATTPFSPNFGNAAQSATVSGYQRYNAWDTTTGGTHTQGMTVASGTQPWWTRSVSLASLAGQTVTLTITATQVTQFRSWFHLDDIEWSVVNATLGTAQAFGVNITTPAAGTNYAPGQIIPLTVQVDANPTGATNPVTAEIYDTAGALVPGGPYILYNDGTHGDVTAGDATWSNNGSVPAQPAPTVPLSAVTSSGWTLRVFGKDATNSTIGAPNGLARGPGTGAAVVTQANFWNVDEILFNVQTALISMTKTSSVISDPVNGVTNPKAIPGATVRYCLLVTNSGPASAGAIIVTDALPATVSFVAGSMKSGLSCAAAATVEDDNNTGADESDPFGASYAGGTLIAITATLANAATMALTFDTTVN